MKKRKNIHFQCACGYDEDLGESDPTRAFNKLIIEVAPKHNDQAHGLVVKRIIGVAKEDV